MMSRWNWWIIRFSRRLLVRASLFAIAGVLSALAAIVLTPFIPTGWASSIGADAVGNILSILAASMLTVATFSLSTMVSTYAAASSGTTPRVVQLLMADSQAQNAIATFIGGFLFSLVGIIALSSGIYGESGRIVLFFVTIIMAGVIVFTFIRWVEHVSRLGRVSDAIDRVEVTAIKAMDDRRRDPWFGGQPNAGLLRPPHPIHTKEIGAIEHLDMDVLEEVSIKANGLIHLDVLPGTMVDPTRPIAWASFVPDDEELTSIRNAFTVARHRSFDQDPRFGTIVLAEIACKALSPGVNDAGTAIEVIAALARTLARWAEPHEQPDRRFKCVFVPEVTAHDLFDDAFSTIGHDGSGSLNVGIRLQKALLMLARLGNDDFRRAAQHQSAMALIRARSALALRADVERLEAIAAEIAAIEPDVLAEALNASVLSPGAPGL